MIKLNFKDAFYLFRISLLYPILLVVIVAVISDSTGYLKYSDILEVTNVSLFFIGILFGLPALLFIEYILYSIGARMAVKDDRIALLKNGNTKASYLIGDIQSFKVFGEIHKFYMFPWLSYKFGVIEFKNGKYLVVTNLQIRKIEEFLNIEKEYIRNLFPSISLYLIYRGVSRL